MARGYFLEKRGKLGPARRLFERALEASTGDSARDEARAELDWIRNQQLR
jgi:hypothetical protein